MPGEKENSENADNKSEIIAFGNIENEISTFSVTEPNKVEYGDITNPSLEIVFTTPQLDSPSRSDTSRTNNRTFKRNYNYGDNLNLSLNQYIGNNSNLATSRKNKDVYQKAPKEFLEMMNEDSPRKRSKSSNQVFSNRIPEKISIFTNEEIVKMADLLVSGKKKEIKDPATTADLINELTNRRVEAMQRNDYVASQKIGSIVDDLRLSYRQRDRETFHNERIEELKQRLIDAKDMLKNVESIWKTRIDEQKQLNKDDIIRIKKRHQEEQDALENEWKTPQTARKFSKRSAQLLQHQTAEKYLALVGNYQEAASLRKEISKLENFEISQKYEDMRIAFNKELERLKSKQEIQINNTESSQKSNIAFMEKKAALDIEACNKRVNSITNLLEEEGSFANFCARKFKKPVDVVVPMSVTINGGTDLPTAGRSRVAVKNTGKIMEFRESSVFSPLPLPTLKIKKRKSPERKKNDL